MVEDNSGVTVGPVVGIASVVEEDRRQQAVLGADPH